MSLPHKTRPYTPAETRRQFLQQIDNLILSLARDNPTVRRQLCAVVMGILEMLDGRNPALPAFHVVPIGTPEDIKHYVANHENYYPITVHARDGDISGNLTALFGTGPYGTSQDQRFDWGP